MAQTNDKNISRREALRRMALGGAVVVLTPLIAQMNVLAADQAEEVIRYNSLADPNEKIPVYADYTSYSSSAYSSSAYSSSTSSYSKYSSATSPSSNSGNNQYSSYSSQIRYSSISQYSSYSSFRYSSFYSSYSSQMRYSSTRMDRVFYSSISNRYNFHANVV